MSDPDTNNLSKQKIQQLIASVGSKPTEDNTQIQTTDYNWHQPHYFSIEELNKIDDFSKKFAMAIAGKFTSLCQNDFNVTIASVTQHFAAEFREQSPDSPPELFLPFSTNQNQLCGVVSIPLPTATVWARQLLGDSETADDSGKDLSELEMSLLSDIGSGIIEAFSSSYESLDFRPVQSFIKGQLPLKLKGPEELCKITFNVNKTDSENTSAAHILILCSELDPVAEKKASVSGHNKLSPEEVSKAILQHIGQMHVYVTAQLASTQLTLDQIFNLQVDDILILGKRVDEPIELMVDGQRVYYGWPAKSVGQYAVVLA